MKKFFVTGVLLLMLLSFSACGRSAKTDTENMIGFWPLNDGFRESLEVSSALPDGASGKEQNATWLLNDTFGFVLDFSTEESFLEIPETGMDLSGDFSVSMFVKAPQRDTQNRTLFSYGEGDDIVLFLDPKNENDLTLSIKGCLMASAEAKIDDGRWHHVAVAKKGQTVRYYVDGQEATYAAVGGAYTGRGDTFRIGGRKGGAGSFDGSIAEVRVFRKALTPDAMTDTVIKDTDNEKKGTRVALKHGIVIDRPQYAANLVAQSVTTRQDIENCRNMGFDHVKLQLCQEWCVGEGGALLEEAVAYVDSLVKIVEEMDYRAIICLSPCASGLNYDFKTTYLRSPAKFEELVKWYYNFGCYVKKQGWDPDKIAIQLMTEPGNTNASYSWTYQSDRMYTALRNALPGHTIITSADSFGNIEYLKQMSPVTDDNVIYSFTTYEPYTVGWSSAYTSQVGNATFWDYMGDVPYPIEPGKDYTAEIEEALKDMPPALYQVAYDALKLYVSGEKDGSDGHRNGYDSLYNADWHLLRAKSLDDWSNENGGNIHMMVVEFGCYDGIYAHDRFRSPGQGLNPEKRIQFVRDMRIAWDTYNIGWCYWDYNEGFTIFRPEYHVNHVGCSPSAKECAIYADYDMLTYGLGLEPDLGFREEAEAAAGDGIFTALSKEALPDENGRRYIQRFEEMHNFWGTNVQLIESDVVEGEHALCGRTVGRGDVILSFYSPVRDYTPYFSAENGRLHVAIWVSNLEYVIGGQIELSTSSSPDDSAELAWEIPFGRMHEGWNELDLSFDDNCHYNGDISDIKTVRVYVNCIYDQSVLLDDLYVYFADSAATE